MRIITKQRLALYARIHPAARGALEHWHNVARYSDWGSLVDLRAVFPHADPVRVQSGRTVLVFNVKGNAYRLITAVHFDRRKLFVLLFLTHADYSRDQWKQTL
jgi:mRNA interferase HigB